jgi:hypothetical protein
VTQNILHFSPLPVTQTARLNSPGSILSELFLHSSARAGFPAYHLDNFQILFLRHDRTYPPVEILFIIFPGFKFRLDHPFSFPAFFVTGKWRLAFKSRFSPSIWPISKGN